MNPNKIELWVRAARPFSFTGSIIPVVLGAIFAYGQGRFRWEYLMLSLLAIVLLHAAINMLSDSDDYENKVDTPESYGSSRVIVEELMTSKLVRKGGIICLMAGCLIGLFLSYERGGMILLFGIIGALLGYSYTGKPFALKYKGLGAPLVFILFGPLMVTGSYYVQIQQISLQALIISVPIGLLTTAILHANDIRDILHDKKAGIRTLSILIGENNAKIIYYGLLGLAYFLIILLSFTGILPYWSLLCFLTLPVAYRNIKVLTGNSKDTLGLITLDKTTAKLQAQFGLILIISLILGILIQ